jgi:hypothetical protein
LQSEHSPVEVRTPAIRPPITIPTSAPFSVDRVSAQTAAIDVGARCWSPPKVLMTSSSLVAATNSPTCTTLPLRAGFGGKAFPSCTARPVQHEFLRGGAHSSPGSIRSMPAMRIFRQANRTQLSTRLIAQHCAPLPAAAASQSRCEFLLSATSTEIRATRYRSLTPVSTRRALDLARAALSIVERREVSVRSNPVGGAASTGFSSDRCSAGVRAWGYSESTDHAGTNSPRNGLASLDFRLRAEAARSYVRSRATPWSPAADGEGRIVTRS